MEIKNKKVCVIEDVITSGGQVLISTADLRKLGAQIENVLCVIHRGGEAAEQKLKEAGLQLKPLFVRGDFPK
jgi:orotate phosphoribosyltransferase